MHASHCSPKHIISDHTGADLVSTIMIDKMLKILYAVSQSCGDKFKDKTNTALKHFTSLKPVHLMITYGCFTHGLKMKCKT